MLQTLSGNTGVPTLNIQESFQDYSFLAHYPEQRATLQELFNRTLQVEGETLTIGAALQRNCFDRDWHGKCLTEQGFIDLDETEVEKKMGLIIEHSESLPGWLIKRNFACNIDGEGVTKFIRIFHYPYLSDLLGKFPFNIPEFCKLLKGRGTVFNTGTNREEGVSAHHLKIGYEELEDGSEVRVHVIRFYNEILNHLRPVALKIHGQCIARLGLKYVKAAEEYLYELPETSSEQPFYQRLVVLSKKENLLSARDSIERFNKLSKDNPKKLLTIAREICLSIRDNPLTDPCLHNIRFLNDDTDTVVFIDGEPVGQLIDTSLYSKEEQEKIEALDSYLFVLRGLEQLRKQVNINRWQYNCDPAFKVIFDRAIAETTRNVIINKHLELKWPQVKPYLLSVIGCVSFIALGIIWINSEETSMP